MSSSPRIRVLVLHKPGSFHSLPPPLPALALRLVLNGIMITSSVRRAALPSTASLPSRAVLLAVSSSSPAPGPTSGNPPYRHQRRYSSSKPPVPPSDGSRGIDPPTQTPAKSVSSGPSSKKDVEKREGRSSKKRAGKDGETAKSKQANSLKLPSVPSTQHLHPHGKEAHTQP